MTRPPSLNAEERARRAGPHPDDLIGMHEPLDYTALLARWDTLTKAEAWQLDSGDLHNLIDEATTQLESARQALWLVYKALGYDTDGDPTPAAVVGLNDLVVDAAREYRDDADETSLELGFALARIAAALALHQQVQVQFKRGGEAAAKVECGFCHYTWPCPTVQALTGDPS